MPRATLVSRALKNEDTGLDLFVPTYKETKGLLSNVIHYQVVLVSNLTCFKVPSHKESDVVQYSVEKKFDEFEELRNKIVELFSGTTIPPIIKKSIIVNDMVLRERRSSLDSFLKFLASSRNLSTCQPLLQFLGVAEKSSKVESLGHNKTPSKSMEHETGKKMPDEDVSGEEQENAVKELFSEEPASKKTDGICEGQDLKRELIAKDAISPKTVKSTEEDDEGHSDLLEDKDVSHELMSAKTSSPKPAKRESGSDTTKPTVSKEPEVPRKVPPPVAPKPATPEPLVKPRFVKKPDSPKASNKTVTDSSKEEGGLDFVDKLDQDDN